MRRGGELVIAAALMLLIAGVLWEVPGIFAPVSLSQAHAACSSGLGALGSLMLPQVQSACRTVGIEVTALGLGVLAALALAAWGVILMRRDSS